MHNSSKLLWVEQWKSEREFICYFIPLKKDYLLLKNICYTFRAYTQNHLSEIPIDRSIREIHQIILNMFDSDSLGTLSSFRKSFLVTEMLREKDFDR